MKSLVKLSFFLLFLHPLASQATLTVTNIALGSCADHCLFNKSDGSLWAMGDNSSGQLGDGTAFDSVNQPEKIVASGVTAIAVGGYYSLFLKSDGSLWAMGDNSCGQLGDGLNNHYYSSQPEQIVASGVTAIAAGGYHSLFLKSDGSLWAMGWSGHGQLGDGTIGDPINPEYSTPEYVYTNQPEQIVASGVIAIAAGGYHSLFIKSDGSLWGMGYNGYGQLGNGIPSDGINQPEQIVTSGVTVIAAGWDHSLFLKSDGSLWAMGGNYVGQLGDGFGDYEFPYPEQIFPAPQPVLGKPIYNSTPPADSAATSVYWAARTSPCP